MDGWRLGIENYMRMLILILPMLCDADDGCCCDDITSSGPTFVLFIRFPQPQKLLAKVVHAIVGLPTTNHADVETLRMMLEEVVVTDSA